MPTKQVVIVGTITYADEGGGSPPSIWPSPGHPSHPIAEPPPGYWGGVAPPLPTHPIAPGGPPPGIWGGGNVPMPTPPMAPGGPPPVIWPSPGHPAHPIAPGGPPLGFWGGGNVPMPTPPIYLPIGEDGAQKKLEAKTAWTPQTGWAVVFVPTEDTTLPTPSDQPATPTPPA